MSDTYPGPAEQPSRPAGASPAPPPSTSRPAAARRCRRAPRPPAAAAAVAGAAADRRRRRGARPGGRRRVGGGQLLRHRCAAGRGAAGDTIGYVSIDLDPSGGQKIEALRTLNKFPAFKDELGLDTDDDIRQQLFDELDLPEDCKIFYAEDIEPWLGERFAVAAVDTGATTPRSWSSCRSRTPTRPRPGCSKLRDCADEGPDGDGSGGWVIDGDWAVVAEDEEGAQAVVDATARAPWPTTRSSGDHRRRRAAGIVSMYAAPEAGPVHRRQRGWRHRARRGPRAGPHRHRHARRPTLSEAGQNPMADALKDFKGMAVDRPLRRRRPGDRGRRRHRPDLVDGLRHRPGRRRGRDPAGRHRGGHRRGLRGGLADPARRADGVLHRRRDDRGRPVRGGVGGDRARPARRTSRRCRATPAALSFGSDFDPEAFFNSGDGSDIPVALKVQGDPDAIRAVLDKITAQDAARRATSSAPTTDGDMS